MTLRIAYANDGNNVYDSFFLDFLIKENIVYLLTFYRRPSFFPLETNIVKMPRIVYAPTDKAEGVYMYALFPLRALFLRMFWKLLRLDAVLGCMATKYGFYAALAGVKPLIVVVFGSDILVAPKRFFFFRFLARFALRKADAVVVDSEVQEKTAIQLGCFKERIFRFPWFDLSEVHLKYRRAEIRKKMGWHLNPVIISVRKHELVYDVESLIDAIPRITSEVPESRFLILGKGTLTPKLERKVKELQLEHYVKFIGDVPRGDVASYLNAADIYVSTSLSDGTSASLLEAMALKVPSVVTNIPGNLEWIKNDWNGFLVPPRDPRSLGEKIVLLIKSEGLRRQMGNNGLETVKAKVDWSRNSRAFTNLILRLTKK